MSETSRAPVAIPGLVKDGALRAERREIARADVPTDACLLCGDVERLAPEALQIASGFDVLESSSRPQILLCPTCAAAQRASVQRLWGLAALAPPVVALVLVAAMTTWPPHGALVGLILVVGIAFEVWLIDRWVQRKREASVPMAWLATNPEAITLQVPSWEASAGAPAQLKGVSAFLPAFLATMVVVPVAWVVWADITPVVALDNAHRRACTFKVGERTALVNKGQRERFRAQRGRYSISVDCGDGARDYGEHALDDALLVSSDPELCYGAAWLVRKGPVLDAEPDSLRLPCR